MSSIAKAKIAPRVLSIGEFCKAYGVGPSTMYQEIKSGALKRIKVGRRTLIPVSEAEAWLERKVV